MNGIICINKPQGFTSFDVIAKMRGISRQRKIGHSGTLDPMATGVLPLLFGTAAKACDIMPDNFKEYTAGFKLGITTNTQDITGEVLTEKKIPDLTAEDVKKAFSCFVGEIEQIPPMFSAVQVNGVRLYDLARQGIEVRRKSRRATVDYIELLSFDGIEGEVKIGCGKGTYVRTIIHDAGSLLRTGAAMTSLVRTASGMFKLSDCITLDEAQALSDSKSLDSVLISTDRVFACYPEIVLSEKQAKMFTCGVKLDINRVRFDRKNELYRIYDSKKDFLAIGRVDYKNEELSIFKSFFGGN